AHEGNQGGRLEARLGYRVGEIGGVGGQSFQAGCAAQSVSAIVKSNAINVIEIAPIQEHLARDFPIEIGQVSRFQNVVPQLGRHGLGVQFRGKAAIQQLRVRVRD